MSRMMREGNRNVPLPVAEFEKLAGEKPPGTSPAQILGVEDVYPNANLTDYIYLFPDVIGKPAAVGSISLKDRFPT